MFIQRNLGTMYPALPTLLIPFVRSDYSRVLLFRLLLLVPLEKKMYLMRLHFLFLHFVAVSVGICASHLYGTASKCQVHETHCGVNCAYRVQHLRMCA